MQRIRIVLVEDDAHISELVAALLVVLGHEVCGTAVTELEAIDAAARYRPDLMIVDVYLRAGNGVSAMNVINCRALMPHIFMTGGPRHIIPPDAIALRKPFGTSGLTQALDAVSRQIFRPDAGPAQPPS